jgi:cytochrome c553
MRRLRYALFALALAAGALQAQEAYPQRWASLCAACHGASGVSALPDTPSLAGQHGFYAATQLFLFRAGRRSNEAMTAVAKTLTDDDLRGFSDLIGKLPVAPSPPAADADATRMAEGEKLGQQHRCASCHGADYSGGQQVPRVGGQREDYLRRSLAEFKAGKRVGYTPAMNEALAGVKAEELDLLAYYLARLR